MSSKSFELAIRKLPKGSFCLIEDFDDTSAVKTRFNNNVSGPKNNAVLATAEADPFNSLMGDFSLLNLSTILNTLDGVGELDDIVIFLTTNCIDKIDPALLRKGRIDHKLYLGHLHNEDIKRYCKIVFPEIEELPEYEFEPILGCDLSALFKEHKHSHIDFLKAIPRQHPHLKHTGVL
jgi:SpoVK/Ycf46/Vps4 family AAA+-type ATPase